MINQPRLLRLLMRFSALIVGLCFSYQGTMLGARESSLTRILQMDAADTQNEPRQKAARLWEEAIAAKGGRERLYSVKNMVISSTADYVTRLGKKNNVRTVALYVFPNRFWDWSDYRPDVFGVSMHMYNYETKMKYVITLGEPYHALEPIEPNEKKESQTRGLVSYLLETEWLKPIPTSVSREKIGRRQVDVVQTRLDGQRVDFAFDRATHLLIRLSYYSTLNNRTYISIQRLSNYVEIDGIKVPQTGSVDDGPKYEEAVQFNVDYNPDIFVRPPPLEAGPEAWRPKGRR